LGSLTLLRQNRKASPAGSGGTAAPRIDAGVNVKLDGNKAIEELKRGGQHQSLGEAIQSAFYRVESAPNGDGFYANNRAQQFSMHFSEGAAKLTVKQPKKDQGQAQPAKEPQQPEIGLRFTGAGYGKQIQPVTGKPEMSAAANRFTYRHQLRSSGRWAAGSGQQSAISNQQSAVGKKDSSFIPQPSSFVEEWYVNRADGIEHGFTFGEPLGKGLTGEQLRVEMELTGKLRAKATGDGKGIVLEGQGSTISYSGLKVTDASGRELEARLKVAGRKVSYEIADQGAEYPLTIDPVWTQVKKLVSSDGAANDQFGDSVAISGDLAVVGANLDDVGSNNDQGSAYLFERNTSGADNWGLVKKLVASDGAASDQFGRSVAIDVDTVIVGAINDQVGGNSGQGSAYLFERNTGGADNWGEVKHLFASDGATNDQFGNSVSISGDTVIVGAYVDDVGGNVNQGTAYIFERNTGGANNWGEVKHLFASGAQATEIFGSSVAISGDTVIVGALGHSIGGNFPGAAYIFERNQGGANNWGEVKQLFASDGGELDSFGTSVAISGDTAIVGADNDRVGSNGGQGSAYLFERNAGGANNWGEIKHLAAADGAALDKFGTSVAISSDTVLVGAPGVTITGSNPGAAYIFERNTGGADNWGMVKHLVAADGAALDQFGISVAISGDTVLVGASLDDAGSNSNQGSAYLFVNQGGQWTQVSHALSSEALTDGRFGVSVSISGDTALVGTLTPDGGGTPDAPQGTAYIFERNAGGANGWQEVKKLFSLRDTHVGQYGFAVSISGDTAVVGAKFDSNGGTNPQSGSAFIYERNTGGANNWGLVKKIVAFDAGQFDNFGHSVSISGDTVIVGSVSDDQTFQDQGSAYIFERNAGGPNNWGTVQKLGLATGKSHDDFGDSVSISGDTAIVGVYDEDDSSNQQNGSAYIFERNTGGANNWGMVQRVLPSDGDSNAFGHSVSISGDAAIVGSMYRLLGDEHNPSQGAAYIFERNQGGANNWGQLRRIVAADGAFPDRFGNSVSISGDMVIVGSFNDAIAGKAAQGSAYIFERNTGGANNWGQVQKLIAADGALSDQFGGSVAISGDTAVVGAYKDDVAGNVDQGSAYVFTILGEPEINVKGNGLTIADGDTQPDVADNTNFGGTLISSGTISRTFTIENTSSTSALTVSGITISGANSPDFSISGISFPATINVNSSTTFTVIFDPSATGLRTATINIANNDSDEGVYDFAIQGTGALPGAALDFDGADDVVTAAGVALANQSFTIEVWARKRAASDSGYLVAQGTQNTNQMIHVGFRSDNTFTFAFYGNDLDVTNAAFADTAWHHWGCVYDAASGSRRIYRDGQLVASDTASAYIGSGALLIGKRPEGFNFNGQIDEVRVWKRVLCQGELQATMNCELSGSELQLAAYYNFNQGLSSIDNTGVTTLPDLAGGDNNGTLVNFALNGASSNWVAPGGVTSGVSCAPFLLPEVNVKGNGVSIANGDSTPSVADDTDFGNVSMSGDMVTHTFTIENSGTAALLVSNITKSGADQSDFTIGGISIPATINAGNSTTFTVTFDPSAPGTRAATLNIANNDCDEGALAFAIQGTGTDILVVDNTTDNGALQACTVAANDCSLRGAIANANTSAANDTIEFDAAVFSTLQTITLGGSRLQIMNNGSLTVNGCGVVRISGNHTSGVLQVDGGANAMLNGLIITEGSSDKGGGIDNSGTVNLNSSTVSDNSVNGSGLCGGGIYNATGAAVTVTTSTISGNFANAPDTGGGGICNATGAVVTVTNSTISGNSAPNDGAGGGIFNHGTLTLINATIANNSAPGAGAGVDNLDGGAGTVNARNSFFSENVGFNGVDFRGELNSQGHNLIGISSGATVSGDTTGNILDVRGQIGPLADNGGPTQTHALLWNSAALDAGDDCVFTSTCSPSSGAALPLDQRGLSRKVDGNLVAGAHVDIGAYERQSVETRNVPNGTNVSVDLRELKITFPCVNSGCGGAATIEDAVTVSPTGVTTAAQLSVSVIDPNAQPAPPPGYTVGNGTNPAMPAFDISTTASYTGPVGICFYLPSFGESMTDQPFFAGLRVLHNEGGVLVDRTTGVNFATKLVCGSVNSLSPFVIAHTAAPTAANGEVAGQIVDSRGKAVGGTVVRMSGTQNRCTITDAQGSYHFADVEANGFYTVTPARANFVFSPAQRSFSQTGAHIDATFTAETSADGLNPLDTAEYFVRQQYLDFLGREPDQDGFEYWSDQLNQCHDEVVCLRARRLDVSAAFFIAQEFQETGLFIHDLYAGGLARKPAFAEYSADRQQVVGGAHLAADKQMFVEGFVQRPDFAARYQSQTTAVAFVDSLINNIRQSSGFELSNQRESLISDYSLGASLNESRAIVLLAIADDAAFKQSQYNAAFVQTEYFGYLRRDLDQDGYDFWLNVLSNREPNNLRGMVCSFITSREYQRRFSSVVTRSNTECGP
jgi:hypothetical protein